MPNKQFQIDITPGPNGVTYEHLTLNEPNQPMQVAAFSGTEETVHLIFYVSGMVPCRCSACAT